MKNPSLIIFLLLVGVLGAEPSFASSAAGGELMMDLADRFRDESLQWEARALVIAKWLFFTLATLELTWAAALWAMEKDSASSLIVAFVRKMMVLGFFYTFLILSPTWIPAIINSLQGAGAKMGGLHVSSITPMTIIGYGLDVIAEIWKAFSDKISLGEALLIPIVGLLLVLVTIAIMLSFVYIAIEFIMTTIEAYIVIGMGAILMGFSGSQWTRDFSQKYIGYAFSVGIKLMVLMLILALIIAIAGTWKADIAIALADKEMGDFIQPMLMIAASSILLALLAIKIPSLASSLLSGAPSLGAAAAVGAAAGAAAGVASLAVGSAGIVGGVAKALGAGGGGGGGSTKATEAANAATGSNTSSSSTSSPAFAAMAPPPPSGGKTPGGGKASSSSASAPTSASTVPPPSGDKAAGGGNKPKSPSAGSLLKKAGQSLPLDHGAVAAAAPKLDHHEP